MIRRIIQLSILMAVLLVTSGAWATTYYIDWVNGADTNNGTSKSTPWKRAPGMQGCLITDTNNNPCRARTHASTSGDSIILKGGVTWPKEALGWDWYFGNSTYFGVDQTWYTGAAWSRPILDNQGVETTASPEGVHWMMRAYGLNQTVDNIEFKGLAQLHGGDNGYIAAMLQVGINSGDAYGGEIKNCYFHGWSHGPVTNGNWDSDGTLAGDNSFVIRNASTSTPDLTVKIHHNVFDGSDTTKDMIRLLGGGGHVYNNYFAYAPNAMFSGAYIWGNTITEIGTTASFCPSVHYNVMENNRGWTIFYNNFIKNTHGGDILTYGIDGYKDYIFNNVIMGDNGASLQLGSWNGGQITLVTGVGYEMNVFNNTIQSREGNNFSPISGPPLTTAALMPIMRAINNHLIGPTHSVYFNAGVAADGKIESNNLGMTNAAATAAGYVATGNYPFYPPDRGGITLGAGKDLRSLAAGIPSTTISDAATAALSDTSCGVKYDAVNHRVVGPNRTPRPRGTTWDIGAYQSTATPQSLGSPKNLKVIP
jgi:hypothetical protein